MFFCRIETHLGPLFRTFGVQIVAEFITYFDYIYNIYIYRFYILSEKKFQKYFVRY